MKISKIILIFIILFLSTGCLVSKKRYLAKVEELNMSKNEVERLEDKIKNLKSENEQQKLLLSNLKAELDMLKKEIRGLTDLNLKITKERDSLKEKLSKNTKEAHEKEMFYIEEILSLKEQIKLNAREQKRLSSKIGEIENKLAVYDGKRLMKEEEFKNLYDEFVKDFEKEISLKTLSIEPHEETVKITIPANEIFLPGQISLEEKGKKLLERFGKYFEEFPLIGIRIECHTDNLPVESGLQFKTNREFSSARAASVADFFQKSFSIHPKKIIPIGYGEHFPVADNETPEGRNINKRVVLIFYEVPAEETGVSQEITKEKEKTPMPSPDPLLKLFR